MKHKYSDFGKQVKIRLIENDKNQEWLIARLKEETGLFMDSSYLNLILTGRKGSQNIIDAIKRILDLT